jgi:hypothetical protein
MAEEIKSSEYYSNIIFENNNIKMLNIYEYIQITKFPIDNFMIDRFWQNIDRNIPIYLDEKLIEWCGYNGNNIRKKEFILKTLKNNNIPIIELKQEQYIEYYNNLKDFPEETIKNCNYKNPQELLQQKWASKINHILITPLNFKRLVMMLKTEKGNQIRDYFLCLELLMKYYMSYQVQYEKRMLEIIKQENSRLSQKMDTLISQNQELIFQNQELIEKVDDIKEQNNDLQEDLSEQNNTINNIAKKLDIATDERAPKLNRKDKREKFMLCKYNSKLVNHQYYVIRAQTYTANKKFKDLKIAYPEMEVSIEIQYQPNSVNLFNMVKEELRNKRKVIEVKGNNISLLGNYTHENFLEDIKELDNSKKEVKS